MRNSGILMHISSLASDYGIGSIGKKAYEFVDFLKRTSQKYWQVLPLNPTGHGSSPYQSPCVFAGNPLLIDLDLLIADGLLNRSDIDGYFFGDNEEKVDFEAVKACKPEILKKAFLNFHITPDYIAFESENEHWLSDYALFMSLKQHFNGAPWHEWNDEIKHRDPDTIKEYTQKLWSDIAFYKFEQYIFYTQWNSLKNYAHENDIEIIGDMPIYAALDSSDVWANTNLFQLEKDGTPSAESGCPPDAFSADGQLWGNPLYDWETMKSCEFVWWIRRVKIYCKLYDIIRLDHFRGFESYYSIPHGAENAKNGTWKKGPGASLFKALKTHVPNARFIAEDLGYLTGDVRKLLSECGYPGMKVLQFAFDPYNDNPYLPYNYTENCIAYTGTHDNDTLIGWYQNESDKEFIRDYLNVATDEWVPAAMIRAVLASSAKTAIIPIQDYLGYGKRMNTPSTVSNENWSYRIKKDALNDSVAYHINHLTTLYKRNS